MAVITIPISDERFAQLRVKAQQAGLSPDEFLRRHVDHLLDSEERFRQAAAHVLEKNADLYKRLA